MLNFPEISKFSDDFQLNFLNSDIILTEFWSFKDSNYSIGRPARIGINPACDEGAPGLERQGREAGEVPADRVNEHLGVNGS